MLNSMRKNLKKLSWTLWLVIATFVGTIFAVWGIGGQGGQQRQDVVAWIDKNPVSTQEFYDAQRRVRNYYQQIFGEKYGEMEAQLQISDIALSQIIQVHVLIKAAREMGVSVSLEDVQQHIIAMPEFQDNGKFSKVRFQRLLKYSHLTEPDFLKQVEADMVRQRVQRLIQDSIWVSDAEVKDQFKLDNEQARLEYLQVDARTFAETVNPTDEELKAYFEANQASYQIPEKVSVNYLEFNPSKLVTSERFLADRGNVSETEIEDYYYEHEDAYRSEKEVRASHILIKSDGSDPEKDAEAKKKADEVLGKIRDGADFTEMAQINSEDSSAAQGGDVGFFPRRGKMVEPFAAAAFDLRKGRVSEVVQSQFGYHIIKVTDIKEAELKPIENVKDELKNKILLERATSYAEEEADRIRGSFSKELGLEALGKRVGITAQTTPVFAEREVIPNLGWMTEFSKTAFALKQDELSSVVKDRDQFFLMTLKERVTAHQATYEEVTDKVKDALVEARGLDQAKEKMDTLIVQMKAGEEWSKLTDGTTVKLGDTGLFARKQSIKGIGREDELVRVAFEKSVGDTFGPQKIRNMFYYFRLVEHQEPEWSKFEADIDQLRNTLVNAKSNKYFSFWIEQQKEKMDVTKNQEFFERLAS